MKTNKLFLKIVLLYFYMYFIGPLIWCIWMVFKLEILSLQECYHCISSPLAITLFISYFFFNTLYIKRIINKLSVQPSEKKAETYLNAALNVHFISIFTFGTIGTFLCLSMLSTHSSSHLIPKIAIGTLSGASLVFLFYIMFSAVIIVTLAALIQAIPSYPQNRIFIRLKHFNQLLYIIGLILFIGTAVASLVYRTNQFAVNQNTILFLVILLLPISMSTFLFYQSNKKINRNIKVESANQSTLNTIFNHKFAIQLLFLILFCVLLFIEKIHIWLPILIIGFCISLIFGRIYCGFFCPVTTINNGIELLFKRIGIKKRHAPQVLHTSLSGVVFFALFLSLFVFSLISRQRLQLFLIITCLGILVSSLFNASFWCNYLCPWGVILKVMSKFSVFKFGIDSNSCVKCGLCSLHCPTSSIQITDKVQSIEFHECLCCIQCTNACPKDAIVIQKKQLR